MQVLRVMRIPLKLTIVSSYAFADLFVSSWGEKAGKLFSQIPFSQLSQSGKVIYSFITPSRQLTQTMYIKGSCNKVSSKISFDNFA